METLRGRNIMGAAAQCKEASSAIFSYQDKAIGLWKTNNFRPWMDLNSEGSHTVSRRKRAAPGKSSLSKQRKNVKDSPRPPSIESRTRPAQSQASVFSSPQFSGTDPTHQQDMFIPSHHGNVIDQTAPQVPFSCNQDSVSNDSILFSALADHPGGHPMNQPSEVPEELPMVECSEFTQTGDNEQWALYTEPWASADLHGVMDSLRSHAGVLEGGDEEFFT